MHRGRFEQLKSFPVYHRDTLLHRKLGILYIAICQDTSDMDFKIHFLMMPASKCLISRRWRTLGLYSLSRWTSYRMMSSSLEAARFGFSFFNRPENLQGPRQHRCRDACQIAEWYHDYNIQSRGFGTSRDVAVRRLTAEWIEGQVPKEVIVVIFTIASPNVI